MTDASLEEVKKLWHGTKRAYLIGFFGSLILTGLSFLTVVLKLFEGKTLIFTLVGLAIIQALFQLLFFLHLGREEKPRFETLIFLFMVMVLLILALGSIWIMFDLNNRVMEM